MGDYCKRQFIEGKGRELVLQDSLHCNVLTSHPGFSGRPIQDCGGLSRQTELVAYSNDLRWWKDNSGVSFTHHELSATVLQRSFNELLNGDIRISPEVPNFVMKLLNKVN